MKETRSKMKIGISLLIAMAFILPAASSVFADGNPSEIFEARDIKTATTQTHGPTNALEDVSSQLVSMYPPGPCGVNITYIDIDENIATGCYDIGIEVCLDDHICEETFECPPAEVKKFLEIYKYHSEEDPDEVEEIYCTDFEDPCEIYDNWATFDAPVWGDNGAIDTWTWSGKRSNSPGHSFHSTAFDTYLPSQLDYLVLNMGGSGIDVSAFGEVEVCFWHWMQGDAFDTGDGTIIIQDAGYVETSFDGSTWTQVGEEYYDVDEWEEECFTVDVTGESTLFVRWVFYSDPTFCYEGWYIDDVCVTGILEGSFEEWWELVFSAHSWPQFIEQDPGCELYVFEPEWCVYQEGTYKVCAWLQVMDECHYPMWHFDNQKCKIVEVGDILDIAEVALYTDPACPVEEGTDVSIYSYICNIGTLDATDTQVKVTVNRGSITPVIFDGAESAPYDESMYYHYAREELGILPEKDVWHVTDFDAYSGSHAWMFSDPTTHIYPHDAGYISGSGRYSGAVNLVLPSTATGFTEGDSALNPVLKLKAKWVLDASTAPDEDFFTYGIYDPSTDTAVRWVTSLPSGAPDLFKTGVQDTWTSIEIPLGDFLSDVCEVGGAFADLYDGDDWRPFISVYTGSSGNTVGGYSWSGILIDDVEILKIVAEEESVFEQTVIVPYLNITDCTTAEFLWEDAGVGQYVITQEILTGDDDMSNNKLIAGCNVYNIYIPAEDLECVDYTDNQPGHAVIEGCCGGVFWFGDPVTTTYGNDWDDCLYVAPNGSDALDFSAFTTITLDIDTWYQLSGNDEGYVETTFDGLHWDVIATFTGDSNNPPEDWEAYSYGIPNNVIGIRFHFVSNETNVNRGWMIDNIVITTDSVEFLEADGTSMDDFIAKATPAGCWWFDSMNTQWFVYDTAQLPGAYTWFSDGDLEPSWGVFDPQYFNLGWPWLNLFPDDIDTGLVWEFSAPQVFYGWIGKTTYYDIPNSPNITGTLEISIDGGANWDVLETYIGSANDDYYGGGLPLSIVVDADLQYWESADVIIGDYLTTDDIMIRWHMVTIEDPNQVNSYAGFGPLTDYGYPIAFYGMADSAAPVTTITISGTFDETYAYFTSAVTVTLDATDDVTGVAATYYEIDGGAATEYTGPFQVTGDGEHEVCYWSVDNEDNVEEKKCAPKFKIDATGPSIEISIADGPGIYLFGNKLMSSEKYIFLFGGVDVKATVSVNGAPLKTVEFYMGDELFGEDTSSPFGLKCTLKNQGAATFKVIAIDVLGKTASASQTVDTYIKLL
jgi:hypothetical protein